MTIVGYGYGLESPPFAVTSAVVIEVVAPVTIEIVDTAIIIEIDD